jgi:hypothetical protein
MPDHLEVLGHELQLLGDVFANPSKCSAAVRAIGSGAVLDGLARQRRGQRTTSARRVAGRKLGHDRPLRPAGQLRFACLEFLDDELKLLDLAVEPL